MSINATDNAELAGQLWGDAKFWDDDLGQWVPEGGKYDRRPPAPEVEADEVQPDETPVEPV